MLFVIGPTVYRLDRRVTIAAPRIVGSLTTLKGDVFLAENTSGEILITDNVHVYAYDYNQDIFYSSVTGADNPLAYPFETSGYCSFQNGRFIVAVNGT